MSKLQAGFGRSNINPPMDIDISGYYKIRLAEGILDDLEANALALKLGDETTILINIDNAGIPQEINRQFREEVSRTTGGFLNGTFNDFDDVSRGYAHAEYIARVVTGGVLQAFDKVQYVEVDKLVALQRQIFAPAAKATPEQLVEPFTGISNGLKVTEGYDMIIPCCIANGYEARSSLPIWVNNNDSNN